MTLKSSGLFFGECNTDKKQILFTSRDGAILEATRMAKGKNKSFYVLESIGIVAVKEVVTEFIDYSDGSDIK